MARDWDCVGGLLGDGLAEAGHRSTAGVLAPEEIRGERAALAPWAWLSYPLLTLPGQRGPRGAAPQTQPGSLRGCASTRLVREMGSPFKRVMVQFFRTVAGSSGSSKT